MTALLVGSIGLAIGGLPVGIGGAVGVEIVRRFRGRTRTLQIRPVLLLVLIELRSGQSVLASLKQAARSFPDDADLSLVSRVASISGLPATLGLVEGPVNRLLTQLARCQRSGASAAEVVRSLLEADVSDERTRRIARARSLPIRLMVPISLLVLPGLILMLYAPALLRLWRDMASPFA